MQRIAIVAAVIAGGLIFPAYAAEFTCKGAGKCVCVETINPASVLGYDATADGKSVNVNIICVNQDTMQTSFYQVRKENGLGGAYNSVPVPHE